MTKTVDITDPQIALSDLVSMAATGAEVVLADRGTPVARVVPIEHSTRQRVAGLHQGMVTASEDFDAPLPEEVWAGEG